MKTKGAPAKPLVGASIDWSNPLSRSLEACWLFNEGAGGVVKDLVGRHDGTVPTTFYSWTRSRSGIGMRIARPTGTTRINIPSLTTTTTFSVEIWANLMTVPGGANSFSNVIGDAAGNNGFWFRGGNPFRVDFIGGIEPTGSSAFVPLEWNHVVLTVSAGNLKYYYNAHPDAVTGSGVASRAWTVIGNDSGEGVDGIYDMLRVWVGRTLSPAEVYTLYTEPYGIFNQPQNIPLYVASGAIAGRIAGPAAQFA